MNFGNLFLSEGKSSFQDEGDVAGLTELFVPV